MHVEDIIDNCVQLRRGRIRGENRFIPIVVICRISVFLETLRKKKNPTPTSKQRERQRQRQTDKQKRRQRQRQTHTQRQRQTETKRDRQTQTQTHRETDRETEREKKKKKKTHSKQNKQTKQQLLLQKSTTHTPEKHISAFIFITGLTINLGLNLNILSTT